jgi:hypothetical protein
VLAIELAVLIVAIKIMLVQSLINQLFSPDARYLAVVHSIQGYAANEANIFGLVRPG